MDEKRLDYIERQALENLRFRLANAETLAKEAATTLTLLLAGMGAALAYAIKAIERAAFDALTSGSTALAVWLMVLGVALVMKCLLTRELEVPTNEPKNLSAPDPDAFSLDDVRRFELENIQYRIDQTKARNAGVGYWLDRVRLGALASPVIFAATAAVSWCQ